MPTSVATVRKCLTEESARILDDAVAVARRRFHSQTTSLHAVSALLSLPSSLLREACSRAGSPAYSSRLQLRALDLCVSVSLDRLPASKSTFEEDNPPPVSNSLYAAIKRSQACQRRQPEMFQVNHRSTGSIYSISSIKVELKIFVTSILDDPVVSRVLGDAGFRSTDIKVAILHPPAPRKYGGRFSPLFLPNLTQSRSSSSSSSSVNFDGDENSNRIGKILAKSSGRNPVLVGVCAREALEKFKKRLVNGRMDGVELICAEMEIKEFVSSNGGGSFDSKLEKLSSSLDSCSGPGLVVSIGELKVLVEAGDIVKVLVSKLSIVFKIYKKKMWLIGAAAGYGTYEKFLNRFPSLEVDWDLHPLPITSFRSSAAESNTKSRLLRSFVPLGGFFSLPSEYRRPVCIINKPFTRCSACTEKYKHELSAIKCKVSSVSVADEHSSSLPSWLQLASSGSRKSQNVTVETGDEKAEPSAKVLWLQRKWDEICNRLHHGSETSNPVVPCSMTVQNTIDVLDSGVPSMLQVTSSQEQNVKAPPKSDSHVSKSLSRQSSGNLNLSSDHASSSSISCVTTDLGLGTPASAPQELKRPDSHLSNLKLVTQKLTEKVAWQAEACYDIGQIISCRVSGNSGGGSDADVRRDTWIGFIGSDKVGKMKMAEALPEVAFGSKGRLISVDFSDQKRMNESNSVYDISLRDGTMVEYIARELSRKQSLVILLENVDKINDPLSQRSILHAIQSGKFLGSNGRETSTIDAIFLVTCSSTEENPENLINFSDKNISEAPSLQMQIVAEHTSSWLHSSSLTIAKKRKQNDTVEPPIARKKPGLFFDLNQALEEDTDDDESRTWFTHFLEQVERKVTFKSVNFDPLATKLLHKMSLTLPKTSAFKLEVDQEVMAQIVAASFYSDEEAPINDWIKEVFGKACGEAHKIYSSRCLKLVSCPGLAIDKQVHRVRLPGMIMINLG